MPSKRVIFVDGNGIKFSFYRNDDQILQKIQIMFQLQIQKKQLMKMIMGILGIYIIYFPTGIYHEKLIKNQYLNRISGKKQEFNNPLGLIILPTFIIWNCAKLYNFIYFPKGLPSLPNKKTFMCGFNIVISAMLLTQAIILTSFPAVMMFKSCNLLVIILIGIFFSNVEDNSLRLKANKILVAISVTVGAFLFQFFDPSKKDRQFKAEALGIIYLVITLFLDGFLPDLQAQIKEKYTPQPTKMLQEINKWVFLISFGLGIFSTRFLDSLVYCWEHPQFLLDLIIWSLLSIEGQFFIYKMIKNFKQHIPPFIITTRKIFTVLLSIMFYGHKTNWIQILGVFLVLSTVAVEFIVELIDETKRQKVLKQQTQTQCLSPKKKCLKKGKKKRISFETKSQLI